MEELPLLLQAFGDHVDVVNGFKISRSDPKHRIIAGLMYRSLMRLLFRLNIRDVDCDFRLFRRNLLAATQLTCDSGVICVELVKRFQDRGCLFVEVPVHLYHRSCVSSQFFRLRHLRRVFIQLFTAWWRLVVHREKRRSAPVGVRVEMRDGGVSQRL